MTAIVLGLLAATLAADPPTASTCKSYGGGACCDPAVSAHLSRSAVFSACRESDDTYLGEKADKDSCRYIFKSSKTADEEKDPGFVEVYVPKQKQVPTEPNDPF